MKSKEKYNYLIEAKLFKYFFTEKYVLFNKINYFWKINTQKIVLIINNKKNTLIY